MYFQSGLPAVEPLKRALTLNLSNGKWEDRRAVRGCFILLPKLERRLLLCGKKSVYSSKSDSLYRLVTIFDNGI